MKSIHGLTKAVVVMFVALSVGSLGAWAETCQKIEWTWESGTEVFLDPAEIMNLLEVCYETTWIEENFQWCFAQPMNTVDRPGAPPANGKDVLILEGSAVLCGKDDWFLVDPFGVGYAGVSWMNPGLLDTPDGVLCIMEQSWVSGDAFTDQQFLFVALEDIQGGTGVFAGANGWLAVPPTDNESVLGTNEGWYCVP